MRQVIISQSHQLLIIDVDQPEPAPGEVLLEIYAVGICGSDLHTFEGMHPFVSYPVLPGHEVSGEIVAVGNGIDPALIGRKAVIEPSIPDGDLPHFEPGCYNISTGLRVMGFQAPGCAGRTNRCCCSWRSSVPEQLDRWSHRLMAQRMSRSLIWRKTA